MILWQAVEDADIERLKHLLTQKWPVEEATVALVAAAIHRRLPFVEMLIPVSDPSLNYSEALKESIFARDLKCAELLIPFCNPAHNHTQMLFSALSNDCYHGGWDNIVESLWPISNINALHNYQMKQKVKQFIEQKIEQKICSKEKQVIEQEIPDHSKSPNAAKKKI